MGMSLTLFIGFIVGLVLGSFSTMLSYRLPRKLSIIKPPSQCPSCSHKLEPRDLVPIFSWLINRGKCRHCQANIGLRYLFIELITTLAVMDTFLLFDFGFSLLLALTIVVGTITFVTIKLEKEIASDVK